MGVTINEYGLPMTDDEMKDYQSFKKKSRKEQFRELLSEAPTGLRSLVIHQGIVEGLCDGKGNIV